MHRLYQRAHALTSRVIAGAIEVHRNKGPGLLENIYEKCLMRELQLADIPFKHQVSIPVSYKGITFEQPLRLDILIDNCLIIEIKAVDAVKPIHKAQLLSYMRLIDIPLGLLLNFHASTLIEGLHRLTLPGASE